MANIEQLPGELNIKTSVSDDFSVLLDFSINLTGYTFTANAVKAGGVTLSAFTVTPTDLAAGQITLSITKELLTTIGVGSNHTWWLKWIKPTSIDRKVLAGTLELVA
jgi:hypothetical protein